MNLKLSIIARDVPDDGETTLAMEYSMSAIAVILREAYPGVTFGEIDSEEV